MNQQVDFRTEIESRGPIVRSGEVATEGGFVVRKVGDGLDAIGDAKAESRTGVTDEVGSDFVIPDLEGAWPQIMKTKSGQVANPHREQGRR